MENTEEKAVLAKNAEMFTDEALRKLIIPLVIEQFLAVAMGMADTFMVASCGESAVSGISLVDTICVLLIGLFSAMASGGAVVAAQFMGRKDKEMVGRASNQLFLAVGGVAMLFMTAALLGNGPILRLIYGGIEPQVMEAARTYFYIAAVSFPFLGIYNGGAALFRAVGNSRVSMQVSLIANILNVAGNAVLIYGFHMGVAGAGISTLCSRALSAVLICLLLRRTDEITLGKSWRLDWGILKKILYIGVPNGVENSIFQLGKLLLSSLIASFGTAAITANAVTNSVGSLQLIPGNAIGLAMITVIGQCVGAGDAVQAKQYLKKLLKMAYKYMIVLGVFLIVLARPVCGCYHLSRETTELTIQLLIYNCVCVMLVHPLSFAQANALRAANDVVFTMAVSITSMWTCRIALAYILADHLGFGVLGVWIAMTIDWAVRAVIFSARVRTGGWTKHMGRLTGA